jgi:hypothetical protein
MTMETKPGYKTSEFWLSLAAMIIGALMASGVFDSLGSDHWLVKVIGIAASVLGALGYTAARAITKGAEARSAAVASMVAANPPKPPQG